MSERWSDLMVRLGSAVVLLALAIAAAWGGQGSFICLTAALVGLALWELSRMHQPRFRAVPWVMALLGAAVSVPPWALGEFGAWMPMPFYILEVLVFALIFAGVHLRDAVVAGIYSFAVVGTGVVIAMMYLTPNWLMLLLGTVILTDLAGYFVGRLIGGPKFWPKVSPKKTWSGIVGGWAASAVFALVLVSGGFGDYWTIALAVVMSFCAQMGDIAESAMKRRAGIKDASNLIPGHGGFLDRFDGVIGATAAMMVGLMVTQL